MGREKSFAHPSLEGSIFPIVCMCASRLLLSRTLIPLSLLRLVPVIRLSYCRRHAIRCQWSSLRWRGRCEIRDELLNASRRWHLIVNVLFRVESVEEYRRPKELSVTYKKKIWYGTFEASDLRIQRYRSQKFCKILFQNEDHRFLVRI